MVMRSKQISLATVSLLVTVAGWLALDCARKIQNPVGLPPGLGVPGETTYVQIAPAWTSAGGVAFSHPHDVIIGQDLFIYVADTDND